MNSLGKKSQEARMATPKPYAASRLYRSIDFSLRRPKYFPSPPSHSERFYLLIAWVGFGICLIFASIIVYSQPSLLPEYGFVLWITVAWWGLPLTLFYLIPSYVKYSHRKKELKKKQIELERKEKRRNDVDLLFRMFKRSHWTMRLKESNVGAGIITKEIQLDGQGEPYLEVSMSYFRKNKRVAVIGLQHLEEEARSFREDTLHDRKIEEERNAEAKSLLEEKSMTSEDERERARVYAFICYSHQDSSFVDRLAEDLKRERIKIWIDKWEIRVGDSILDKINEGIERNDYLITVLSKASVKSNWVRKELNAALMKELNVKSVVVLPILLQECKIPPLIAEKKYADFRQSYESGLTELLSRFEK